MIKFFNNIIVRIIAILLLLALTSYILLQNEWYLDKHDKAVGLVCNRFYKYKIIGVPCGVYYIYRGDKYYAKGELNNAVKYYNIGLRDYPAHSQARCNLANIYVSYEDYSSAVEEYRTALKYKPKFMACRMDLGIILAETLSEYDEAISEYQKVADTKKFPNFKSTIKENKEYAYYNMGLAYRGKTMFAPREKLLNNEYLKNAVISYDNALKINKNSYDSLYNLALTHHLLGNTKEAGLNYCKAIETDPMKYEAHLNLGILLDGLKYYDEAINEFRKAGLLIDDGDYKTILYLNDLLNDSFKKDAIFKYSEKNKLTTRYYVEEQEVKKSFWDIITEKFRKKNRKENLDEDEQNVIFKKGKPVLIQEKETEFKKRMKKCESKDIFKEML